MFESLVNNNDLGFSFRVLQKYISRDVFLFYSSIDENLSWYMDENMATFVPGRTDKTDADFVESNIMRCKFYMRH